MEVRSSLLCLFQSLLGDKEVSVCFLSPFLYLNGAIGSRDDVMTENVLRVCKPDVRMECVVDHNVVFHRSREAFAQFQSSV